ncbi:hypothetical protein EOD41_03865 [Mucilaginibacter limnophilus]|uniref:Aromatic hydrocarbon degradation protein n=1 Tax=Mucilaginibacter limnophilus TaxID=1932778 RepID=A0A3S2VQJ2_9SPHI|nr:outer membrane protein transport protein [Mucilaginibacter limnophilus]RVU03079.1 hypothetical protein EOD41_03865 [Mucilaginibacter limnophilus]
MKAKYILPVIALAALTQGAYAQYAQDAINFSSSQSGSTSRVKALGNAGTALGGDLSSISINPAGIGFFTGSELSITPEFNGSKTSSILYGNRSQSTKNSFNLNNAAVVFYSQLRNNNSDKTKGWLSLNFGASYNRTSNFYNNALVSGQNTGSGSSIADFYAELGTNFNYVPSGSTIPDFSDSPLAGIAYSHGLTVTDGPVQQDNGVGYFSIVPTTAVGPNQRVNYLREGGASEVNLALGANHSNNFYIGFGIGITSLRSDFSSTFTESGVENGTGGGAYNTSLLVDQSVRGTGFNAKLGAIYRPSKALRLGATITTPTWYNMEEIYSETVETRFGNEGLQRDGNDYQTQYNLTMPFRASFGAAVFIGDRGFITGDVEYVDYKGTKLSSDDFDMSVDNDDIDYLYKSTLNYKVGAELRATDNFFVRGGYNIQSSPNKFTGYNAAINNERQQDAIKTVSGGLGYRKGAYYIDATYSHSSGNYYYAPYMFNGTFNGDVVNPDVNLKRTYNNVFLTLGFRF